MSKFAKFASTASAAGKVAGEAGSQLRRGLSETFGKGMSERVPATQKDASNFCPAPSEKKLKPGDAGKKSKGFSKVQSARLGHLHWHTGRGAKEAVMATSKQASNASQVDDGHARILVSPCVTGDSHLVVPALSNASYGDGSTAPRDVCRRSKPRFNLDDETIESSAEPPDRKRQSLQKRPQSTARSTLHNARFGNIQDQAKLEQMAMEHPHNNFEEPQYTETDYEPTKLEMCKERIQNVMFSQSFEMFVGGLVLFNFAVIAVETQTRARVVDSAPGTQAHKDAEESLEVINNLNIAFFMFYFLECTLRMFCMSRAFFLYKWNLFDFVMVLGGGISLVLEIWFQDTGNAGGNSIGNQVVRILKVMRVARASRILISFQGLYLLVSGLLNCAQTLCWVAGLVFITLTIWSIIAMEYMHPLMASLDEQGYFAGCHWCGNAFETIFKSNLTFFQMITGDGWSTIARPMIEQHPWSALIFVGVIFSMTLGLLNLVTAVIVDTAARAQEQDIMVVSDRKRRQRAEALACFRMLCVELDQDRSGGITLDELREGVADMPELDAYLSIMGVEDDELADVFELLDAEQTGSITHQDFAQRLYKMKTQETSTTVCYIKHVVEDIKKSLAFLERSNSISLERESLTFGADQPSTSARQIRNPIVGFSSSRYIEPQCDDDPDHETGDDPLIQSPKMSVDLRGRDSVASVDSYYDPSNGPSNDTEFGYQLSFTPAYSEDPVSFRQFISNSRLQESTTSSAAVSRVASSVIAEDAVLGKEPSPENQVVDSIGHQSLLSGDANGSPGEPLGKNQVGGPPSKNQAAGNSGHKPPKAGDSDMDVPRLHDVPNVPVSPQENETSQTKVYSSHEPSHQPSSNCPPGRARDQDVVASREAACSTAEPNAACLLEASPSGGTGGALHVMPCAEEAVSCADKEVPKKSVLDDDAGKDDSKALKTSKSDFID